MSIYISSLSENDKQLISDKNYGEIEETHIMVFHNMLKKLGYSPQRALWQYPEIINPVPETLDMIQIIHLPDHWVCCFYNSKTIYIYDSLNRSFLTKELETVLERLFPYNSLNNVNFPLVQQQPNSIDCGIYAIAFAVSRVFQIPPELVHYDHDSMRSHLLELYHSDTIRHFPQDPKYSVIPLKPLAAIIYNRNHRVHKRSHAFVPLESNQPTKEPKRKKMENTWQGLPKLHLRLLTKRDTSIIKKGDCLTDCHMSAFIAIVQNFTNFLPYETIYLQNLKKVKCLPPNANHIQILPSRGHWVCCYFNSSENSLFIYDSMNNEYLEDCHKLFLKKIFPQLHTISVKFPKVQSQVDLVNCGVFAIAFAVSLICGVKPETVNYHRPSMRPHLLNLLENHRIEHFPIDNRISSNISATGITKEIEIKATMPLQTLKKRIKEEFIVTKKRNYDQVEEVCEKPMKKRKSLSLLENITNDNRNQILNLNTIDYHNKPKEVKNKGDPKLCEKNKISNVAKIQHSVHKKRDNGDHPQRFDSTKQLQKIGKVATNFKALQSSEYYIQKLSKNLDLKSIASARMEAEQIVQWCFTNRKNEVCRLERTLMKCKEQAALTTTRNEIAPADLHSKLTAVCGISKHLRTTEAYFADTAYKQGQANELLVLNEAGLAMNLLPTEVEKYKRKKHTTWFCDDLMCKVDDPIVFEKYNAFLKILISTNISNVNTFVQNIQKCKTLHSNPNKLGHPSGCYNDCLSCQSTFIPVLILAPHFPNVRYMKTLVQQIVRLVSNINRLDKAFEDADVTFLLNLCQEIKNKATSSIHKKKEIELDQTILRSTYKNAFLALTKRSLDILVHACISCEKLCSRRDIRAITNFKKPIETEIWTDLLKMQADRNCNFVCNYCANKLKNNKMPPTCVLNNLRVPEQPEEIRILNDVEKMLVQRAKAFQVVMRMGTVTNKKLPPKQKVPKVKGRTFHLPLPIQETLNKICDNHEPINNNHELYILVRSIPNTSTKIVWENIVNVNKVLACLVKLKEINPYYKNIILPKQAADLLKHLSNVKFEVDDILPKEDNRQDSITIDYKNIHDIDNSSCMDKPALLTPMEKTDSFYDQYTIYPVNEKRINETSTALYQMKKVEDIPMDNRNKCIDLLCFPDLYPFGENGQHAEREIHLNHFEYIKNRLMSKWHPQFRLNIQYLFFLLNDNNNRQLKAGIFHKLNIANPSSKYTANTYLDELKKDQLETNLSTVFSRLRNTEQYWKIPRTNLQCMVDHYGAATWFLTLSPAEWLWNDLTDFIRQVNAPYLDATPRTELIAADPVSTSRFIENKFHAMLDFICSNEAPLGKIVHYFWRREYQGRGLQHYHMLLWAENAPIIGESDPEMVADFIMKYVTCRIPDKAKSPILHKRVTTHQKHHHNHYCLRTKKTKSGFRKVCRFGFPRSITANIIIRDVVTAVAGRKMLKTKSRLYDIPRAAEEEFINDYNPAILLAWEGNVDIQFCGEKSRTITYYITKYDTKGEKSYVTDTLTEIDSTKSLQTRLWAYSLRALNNRECGALEAADTLLGISLFGTDPRTKVKWINVNEIRAKKLKNRMTIERLSADSTDIFCPNITDDFYPNRPITLESYCLYDFTKWFDLVSSKPTNNNVEHHKIKENLYLRKRTHECLINHFKYRVDTQPEKYYFSLLFLFKSWRNVEVLKNGCETYAEAFETFKPNLKNAMEYHEKLSEKVQAFDQVEEIINQKIKDIEKEELSNCTDSLECKPIEAEEAMKDFIEIHENIAEVNIETVISKLNADQKRVFDKVVNAMQHEPENLRLYVSGEGGTGKSYLIYAIRCWTKQVLLKRVAITAPTGIAAYSIQGLTIHRLFQLPIEHGSTTKYRPLSDIALKILREQLRDVPLIIIDEVSMISNITLMYIHLRLTEVFDTGETKDGWFGKKHILLFGDLLQLPPVHENPAYVQISPLESTKYIGSYGNFHLWKELFAYEELTINMRQKEDVFYRDMLSRLRIGLLTVADKETLKAKQIIFSNTTVNGRLKELCNLIITLPLETVCLFPTRNMCDVLNKEMLTFLATETIELHAKDSIQCRPVLLKKVQKVLKSDEENCSNTGGLPKTITIKLGSKIMLLRNIDVSLGLVNGTVGNVKLVTRNIDNKNDIKSITIVLTSGAEHVIEKISVKFEIMDGVYIFREQFPICLSYAITIHKSQGLSLKKAVIDAGNNMFAPGQAYVAFSRLESLEGLYLINFDPASIKASAKAIHEYNRLRQTYRPDLPVLELVKNSDDFTIDNKWAAHAEVLKAQSATVNVTNEPKVRGIPNIDGASCYASATLQCIFNCVAMRNEIKKLPRDHRLHLTLADFLSDSKNVDVLAVKNFVNGLIYGTTNHQDAAQFISDLFNQIPTIRNIVEHNIRYTTTCLIVNCKYTTTSIETYLMVSLPVSIATQGTVALQELFDHEFTRRETVSAKCDHCFNNQKTRKSDIASVGQCLIVQLNLFEVKNQKLNKIKNCRIKNVPATKINIGGYHFKVISAIFHTGTMDVGHYTSMLRQKSTWLWINDSIVTKKTWPKNASGAYILFLQRV